MNNSKTCTKCGQIKSITEFHRDKSRSSGLFPQCKLCVNARMLEYGRNNAEANRKRANTWYKSNRSRAAQTSKAYKSRNRNYYLAYSASYRATNREKMIAYLGNYYQTNKPKFHNYASKRRIREQTDYLVTPSELARLYRQPCAYCGKPSEHIDHIVPLSRGGQHRIGNLTGACAKCNLSKGSKFISEWKKGNNEAR